MRSGVKYVKFPIALALCILLVYLVLGVSYILSEHLIISFIVAGSVYIFSILWFREHVEPIILKRKNS